MSRDGVRKLREDHTDMLLGDAKEVGQSLEELVHTKLHRH